MGELDLRLLAPFVALAEELHFGRAASRLHVTQSGLSQQIRRLERQLGVALFERDTRHVRLTAAGQAFLTGARESVATAHLAVREARRAAEVRTPLRVGVDIDCPQAVVRRVRLFGATRADVELRLHLQQQDDVVRDLLDDRLDLAVGWTAPPPGADSLESAPFVPVVLHGVVRADDPLAAGDRLSRRELSGRCLVVYSPSLETRPFYDFFLSCFPDPRGRLPQVTHVPVLDDAQAAMLDAVEDLGGFTLCVGDDPPDLDGRRLVTRPFDPPVVAGLVAMWRARRRPALLADLTRFVQPAR
ncbi:LysR family transcriptional regulator [Geodermatophilus sp. SYSU D00710]